MKNIFTLRVSDPKTGGVETLTIDLDAPLPEQLSSITAQTLLYGKAQIKLYVGENKDYDPQTIFDIMRVIGSCIEIDVVPDNPEVGDLHADIVYHK